jgi:hypothetical protein
VLGGLVVAQPAINATSSASAPRFVLHMN